MLINNLIEREILPQCKLVITSRPIATEKLQNIADVTIEVLGFTEESRKSFIEQELRDHPKKIELLSSLLDTCMTISNVCYLPIMVTFLVYTFSSGCLPHDEAELFEKFITLVICRFLQKMNINPPVTATTLCLIDLPEVYLNDLSKFAYKAIRNEQYSFTEEDVGNLCSNFTLAFKNFHGLG